MGRNLSPVLRRELANLDKDADSRKSAMKALKSYVKDLDSKAIPMFLEQVSETKETGSLSGEYTISLYEVLARVHGVNIVPQIDSIMSTIVKTLASSAGSFPLQQACSKVVPAIARYGMDPTTPENKKRHIIHSLCRPLSDSLLGSQESLTSGAALCLKALVESDNWRFASDEMVNTVCQNVAAALEEKSTQTNSHMGLVMALAKHNALTFEAYSRLLIQSGLRILHAGALESNSQKRLSAIQMVNFMMKCLDPRNIYPELELITKEMEKCQSDQMAFVRGAAFEASQTARRIMTEKGPKFEKNLSPCTGSNFSSRDNNRRRNIIWGSGDQSPESQTLDSFIEYDYLVGTPLSSRPVSPTSGFDQRSVNRRLWRYENGGVDVSLKDGLFSKLAHENGVSGSDYGHTMHHDSNGNGVHRADDFLGFHERSPRRSSVTRSLTPSPQRPRSQINVDNIKIFTTPRKLLHSLQDSSLTSSGSTEKSLRRFRSPSSSVSDWSPVSKYGGNGSQYDPNDENKENGSSYDGTEQLIGRSESVSSTKDVMPAGDHDEIAQRVDAPVDMAKKEVIGRGKIRKGSYFLLGFSLFVLVLAIIASPLWFDDQRERSHLAPT
ncbi:protein SINE1-like [Punica granatum]|uniref:Protein SINE1-like n=1 Tax=Punica granatum TaxID=22663 RepID=A0A6P8CY55_PUNGR|nr:protein SINE1-like [Punica granatum]XP_031389708.1 protein SINE1-like [Punica granatum]